MLAWNCPNNLIYYTTNAFYFVLIALFGLKIFKFLFRRLGQQLWHHNMVNKHL